MTDDERPIRVRAAEALGLTVVYDDPGGWGYIHPETLKVEPIPAPEALIRDQIRREREEAKAWRERFDGARAAALHHQSIPAPLIHALRLIGMPGEIITPDAMAKWLVARARGLEAEVERLAQRPAPEHPRKAGEEEGDP